MIAATGLPMPTQVAVNGKSIGSYASGKGTGVLDANKPDFLFLAKHDECKDATHLLQLKDGLRYALVLYQKLPRADDAKAKAKAKADDKAPRKELGFFVVEADTERSQRTATLVLLSASVKELTVSLGDTSVALTSEKLVKMPLPRAKQGEGDLSVSVGGKVLATLDTQTFQDHAIVIYHNDSNGSPACVTFENRGR
ncbi:MAG: hypothetical protein ACOYOF_13920 [Verrucomicrobiaceae bacterium]